MTFCGPKPELEYHVFKTNYRGRPLTLKFWSKYDNLEEQVDPSRVAYYEKEIDKSFKYDDRFNMKLPRYTNQMYGWVPGYKICFLQECGTCICQDSSNQQVDKELLQQYLNGRNICTTKKLLKPDHWKIV